MKLTARILLAIHFLFIGAAAANAMPAAGAALVPLFSGAAFGGGLLGAAAAFAAQSVVSWGLSKLAMAVAGKPETGGGGIKTSQTMAGEDTPQSFIVGRYATGGAAIAPPYVFDFKNDQDGEYLVYVVALSDLPIDSLESIIIDGRPCLIAARPKVAGESGYIFEDAYGRRIVDEEGKLNGYAWVRVFDGTQTAADPKLVEMFGNHKSRPWGNDMIMTGVAYAVVTFKYRSEKFTGLPDCRYVVRGAKLYDPRTGQTAFTENPAVIAFNIARGITLPGNTGTWGIGAPASAFPAGAWNAAMNACDEVIEGEKRYRAGYEISLDSEPLATLDEILKACGGDIAECGGSYNIAVGAPPVAAASITDEDIIISDDRTFYVSDGLAKVFNGVNASYPDPAQLWEEREAVPFKKAEWISEDDGRELIADLQLPAVPYPGQVRRLMRELAADNRRQRRHIITVGPWALGLMPLQSIRWTSAPNGYSNKLFEITSLIVNPATLNVTLALRERDPADYSFDAVADGLRPSNPSVSPEVNPLLGVIGFAVSAEALKGADGISRRPAIRLSWSSGAPYQSISYQFRVKGQAETINGSVLDVGAGTALISGALIPATDYEVRARAVIRGRVSEWTYWHEVRTPGAFLTDADFEAGVRGLFEDAGMRAIEYMSSLPTSGNKEGRTVFLTTDGKLYRFTGGKWVPVVENAIQGALTETHFAQGISIPRVVDELPTAGNYEGRIAVLKSDGKLYRFTGGMWTANLAAQDISGSIAGSQIANSAIDALKLAQNAVGNTHITDGAITTRNVRAGAIAADQIAAGAVVASKIGIGDFTNLAPDDQIQDPSAWALYAAANIDFDTASDLTATKPASRGLIRMRGAGAGTYIRAHGPWFPVQPGAEYWAGGQTWNQGGGVSGAATWNVQFVDAAGTGLSTPVVHTNATGEVSLTGAPITAPPGAQRARLFANLTAQSTGNWIFAAPFCRRRATGELIVDGAITAQKIKAGAIESDHVSANAITAAKIAAGAIGADQIAAGAIVASKIAIADFTNLVADAAMLDPASWQVASTSYSYAANYGAANPWIGSRGAFRFYPAGAETSQVYSQLSPARAGEQYYAEWSAASNAPQPIGVGAFIQFFDANLNSIMLDASPTKTTPAGEKLPVYSRPAPANTAYVRTGFRIFPNSYGGGGEIVAGGAALRRRATGELIVDGAITADKIEANSIHGGLIAAAGVITKAAQIGDAVITNAKIQNATITTLKIGNNQLYVPRFYSRADVVFEKSSSSSAPVLLFNENIPDFNGGGYIIAFNAIVDSNIDYDSFGRFQLFIDGALALTSAAGVRTSGANTGGWIPISLIASHSGNEATNIRIRGWSHTASNTSGGDARAVIRNMTLTVSGSRR